MGTSENHMPNIKPATRSRLIELAPGVKKALARSEKAKAAFDGMPYSHQNEYIEYIDEAKKPETRARRIARTVETLSSLSKASRKE